MTTAWPLLPPPNSHPPVMPFPFVHLSHAPARSVGVRGVGKSVGIRGMGKLNGEWQLIKYIDDHRSTIPGGRYLTRHITSQQGAF